MVFDNAAANLIGYQKVEYTLQGFNKNGGVVHTATYTAVDLMRLQPPGSPIPPNFGDMQDTMGIQLRLDDWVVKNGVCSFVFKRTGDMRLTPASGVHIVRNGVPTPYSPPADMEGMVFSVFVIDGVVILSGSVTRPGGPMGPNIGEAVRFLGPAQYRAVWNETVNTTVKWRGFPGLRSPEYTNVGSIKWMSGIVSGAGGTGGVIVFPEKPQIAPNIDITATRVGNTP